MEKKLFLEIFEKVGDGYISDIDISHYDLARINKICPPEDPLDIEYCDGYFVEENEFHELKKFIVEMADLKYVDNDFNIITRRL